MDVEKVEVTQADRDAAADFKELVEYGDGVTRTPTAFTQAIRHGGWDKSMLVQAFASHRLAALSPSPAETDGIREAALEEAGPCECCGKPVRLGQFVLAYEDVGEVHVDCDQPYKRPDFETVDHPEGPMPVQVLLGEPLMRCRLQAAHRHKGWAADA